MSKKTSKLTQEKLQELTEYRNEKERSGSEALRVLAILLFDRNSSSEDIKLLTEYDRKYASNLRRKYLKIGVNALNDRKKKQPRALLTKKERADVIKTIKTSTPRSFGFEIDYWTTAVLGEVIKSQYSVQYKSRTPLTLLFKEARFTYHKPDKQYRARNQQNIDQWVEKNTPIIRAALEDENTVVLVADEMMLSTKTTTQKIWLPKGECPKIDESSKRALRCIYGALDIKSGREHAVKTMGANSQASREFLEHVGTIYSGYRIVLLWDNAIWHKSAVIKDFLATTKHNFHLINFPPYAPELNPQEHVWKYGRKHVTHNTFIENIDHSTDQFVRFLNHEIFNYQFL